MWVEQQTNKIVYITRGLPGSGKSTLAKKLAGPNGVIFSTDEFFYDSNNVYRFDPSLLRKNHLLNQKRAYEAMESGVSPIVIDNTNVRNKDMKLYVNMALKFGYQVKTKEPDTPWKFDATELAQRNTHGASLDTIQGMLKRWQKSKY